MGLYPTVPPLGEFLSYFICAEDQRIYDETFTSTFHFDSQASVPAGVNRRVRLL